MLTLVQDGQIKLARFIFKYKYKELIKHSINLSIKDRYSYRRALPVMDNTSVDWIPLQGREQDGWTSIQFRRRIDTCDLMDVTINVRNHFHLLNNLFMQTGINNLIYAYGLIDVDETRPDGDITYHQNRRGAVSIPLLSYYNIPSDKKFAGLKYLDFSLNNVSLLIPLRSLNNLWMKSFLTSTLYHLLNRLIIAKYSKFRMNFSKRDMQLQYAR